MRDAETARASDAIDGVDDTLTGACVVTTGTGTVLARGTLPAAGRGGGRFHWSVFGVRVTKASMMLLWRQMSVGKGHGATGLLMVFL